MTKTINELHEYESNPRQISDDQFQSLCERLIEFGFVRPLIVNQDNVVIGGNMRLRAAKHLVGQGYKDFAELPVYRYETKDDAHLARVAMIDNNEWGEYDIDKLVVQLDDLSIDVGELPDLGFDSLILDDIKCEIGSLEFQPQTESNTFDDIAEKQLNKRIKCPHCGKEFNPND